MELLLQKGASTEATDSFNNTPLHLAIRSQNTSLVELLLQRCALTGAAYNGNHTPLDLVARYGCHDRMAELLLEKGHTSMVATSSERCLDGS